MVNCECGTSGFPRHMVFMRHLESESNLVHALLKSGVLLDPELLREFRSRPDSKHRLSERAVHQAPIVARWIDRHLLQAYPELANGFDAYRTSPYNRCKESLGLVALNLPQFQDARVKREMRLRERDRGAEGPLTTDEHRQQFPLNAARLEADSLMWIPVEGESVDSVATSRVRSLLGMIRRLHEEEDVHSFFGSTHGELNMAVLAALFNWGPEEWATEISLPENRISNGALLQVSTVNPWQGVPDGEFHLRLANPLLDDGPGEWRTVVVPEHSPAELLEQARRTDRIFPPGMLTALLNQAE